MDLSGLGLGFWATALSFSEKQKEALPWHTLFLSFIVCGEYVPYHENGFIYPFASTLCLVFLPKRKEIAKLLPALFQLQL